MKRGAILLAALIALASCSNTTDPLTGRPQVSNTAAGAGIGAAVGALGGFLIAKDKSGSDQRKAALIGAGVGALVGGGVGAYMDNQEQELRQQLINSGVSVSRNGNEIILNMPSNVTFATGQDSLNANFFPVLNSVAIILNKYPRTLLDIDGHT
ncbi:MAG: glycine zipper domain-containing protein, partial [Pseudomonadota bacterium]